MELVHKNYHIGESGTELQNFAVELLIDFYTNRVELKDGVREFLEHLLNSGVKMCVATATDSKLVTLAMKRCGLEKYFLKLFSCGDIGKGKEEPDIFLLAYDFLGESIEGTWVFEDSLVSIETTTKIGLPTVGIYDSNNFGQDQIKRIATKYIDKNETLLKLL
jgi:HAD superfamily hydrolase (TIGR01509 family)